MLPELSFRKKSQKSQKPACPLLCWDSIRQQWGKVSLNDSTRKIKERAVKQIKEESFEQKSN